MLHKISFQVKLHEDEFSGLIGNIAGSIIRDRVGGTAGDVLGNLVGNFGGHGGIFLPKLFF